MDTTINDAKSEIYDPSRKMLDVSRIREDFPILQRQVHGKRLVYLDSAATSQKPNCVINALSFFYRTINANIHRGVHTLSEESSSAYEALREKIANFIGGVDARGIVFTRNTTESLNMVALSWGKSNIKEGDEILLTEMEHHSNLVPWILLAKETGAVLKHIPVTDNGTLDMAAFYKLLNKKTKLVSVSIVSNVLGTINPVEEIIDAAHKNGSVTVLDGAQSVPHIVTDAKTLDCDFLAFSAHKMLGPTGIGVLYGKPEILEQMEPYLGGGGMIEQVELCNATWAEIPWKFEAGTPNYADVAAFSSAIDYLERIGMGVIREHEKEITEYAVEKLLEFDDLILYGPQDPEIQAGVFTFFHNKIHPHDLSTILDRDGIAIRAGHHCAQPLMMKYKIPATARASAYIYNDKEDIDELVESLNKAKRFF